jgi:hypothetical protein
MSLTAVMPLDNSTIIVFQLPQHSNTKSAVHISWDYMLNSSAGMLFRKYCGISNFCLNWHLSIFSRCYISCPDWIDMMQITRDSTLRIQGL